MKWQPGKSPLQRQIQNAQARSQARRQRDLQGGGWAQQQKAKMMNDLQLRSSPARHTSPSSRDPLSVFNLGQEDRPSQLGLSSMPQPSLGVVPALRPKPSATISRTWPEFDIQRFGQQGMDIHTTFSVANLLGRTGSVVAHFYFAGGGPLKDINHNYGTKTGNVCVTGFFTPRYHNTRYNDFVLFMPYFELHLIRGNYSYSLKFFVKICDNNRRQLAWSGWVPFTYPSA